MSIMFETRAQAIGVKPKVLAARTFKNIAFIRERLMKLTAPWADVDNSVENALQDLLGQFDAFEQTIRDSVEWLNGEAGT